MTFSSFFNHKVKKHVLITIIVVFKYSIYVFTRQCDINIFRIIFFAFTNSRDGGVLS